MSDTEINSTRGSEDGELDDLSPTKGDDEDIPDDFFDDFSNQDFMNGLDIVDAWDETEKNKKNKQRSEKEGRRRERRRSRDKAKSTEREKHKRSEERKKRSRERRRKDGSPHGKRNKPDSDLRRDPNKTKRDLEKDRENYAKKKEQKLISKVVETGLVPPGMESEVNLNEIEEKEKLDTGDVMKDRTGKDSSKRDDIKSSRERRSQDRSRERRRRSRSFNRASPIFMNRLNERNIERRRERSIDRVTERSIDRLKERNNRSRERRRTRTRSRDRSFGRTREYNPIRRKRRSRSISDRERWLKNRRSESPERKYRGRLGEEKLSFLEEIKMKLDGYPKIPNPSAFPYQHSTPSLQPKYIDGPPGIMPNTFQHVPAPIQGGPSNQYQYPPVQHSPYDQNFFIGDGQPTSDSMNGGLQLEGPQVPVLGIAQQAFAPPDPMVNFITSPETIQRVGPVPAPNSSQIVPVTPTGINNVAKLMEQIRAATNSKVNQTGAAAQLLEEKKLSLTDYLSISSRPTAYSSSPDALTKKVNVLSRCQDILKELSGDKKQSGKLIVAKCSKGPLSAQSKTSVSPLLRKQAVRFTYSTFNRTPDKPSFLKILNKALLKTKVIPEIIDLIDEEEVSESTPAASSVASKKSPFSGAAPKYESPVKQVLMKMCQTDPVQCEDCHRRKSVQYKTIGIQCGESERYNVGVQVVEADIIDSKIPKNQSLAYLTPAQLLGRGDTTSTKVDPFGPYGRPQHFRGDPSEFRDWPRGYNEAEMRRGNYPGSPPYPGSAMRDVRFPRY